MKSFKELARHEIVVLITSITGFYMLLEYYIDIPILRVGGSQLMIWTTIVAAFILFLGLVNITKMYIDSFTKSKKVYSRLLSVYFLCLLYGSMAAGLLYGTKEGMYPWLFENLYSSTKMAVSALPAFYIFSAAFKAFTAKKRETYLFLASGLLILFKNAPMGATLWKGFDVIGKWILDVPMVGANRAMMLSMGIGLVAYCIRTLIGEREQFEIE